MASNELDSTYEIVSVNRIPPGYSIYHTGRSDEWESNPYRKGDKLKFRPNDTTKIFKMCQAWYAIGGRVLWEGCDMDDEMEGALWAPATTHGVNAAGDFNKVAIGGGINIFVPAAPGTGAWQLDLTAKFTGTNVLKCTPVPIPGNTGWFDFNHITQEITVNASQTGGYHILDADRRLHMFGSSIFGRKDTTGSTESGMEVPDVVGKLIPPQWEIRFTLTTTKTILLNPTMRVGIIMITAAKQNVA